MEALEDSQIRPSNRFYHWIIRSYGTHVAMGVRRQLDMDRHTYSLRLLISKIATNPQVITRRSFVHSYPPYMKQHGIADEDFDDIAGEGSVALPK